MNNKFLMYAIFVIGISTVTSWTRMLASATDSRSGSSWSSRIGGGGGSYGGGAGGGGHK